MTAPLRRDTDTPTECANSPVTDSFADERRAGAVIGTLSTSGATRLGRDIERQVAIDGGALRFQPLIDAGWARQGIAYGPFRRESGLVMAVSITNGHNTSHATPNPERFAKRLYRWAKGPNADPWHIRAMGWMLAPRKKSTLRRFRWWKRISPGSFDTPDLNENLALGWFTSEAPADPVNDGCGFIVHAAESENGELRARTGDRCLTALRRLMNLRICYVVALRERGAVYYAAASEGAHGMAAFPEMRPIAIDPFNDDDILYAGIHQSTLGQIGFRVDTRVHGVRIGHLADFSSPFGTAHVGDSLTGTGPAWKDVKGDITRSANGASSSDRALALADPAAKSGLIHALFETGDAPSAGGLVWRLLDKGSYWLLEASPDGCTLRHFRKGVETVVARDTEHRFAPNTVHSLQILDFNGQIGCYLDGDQLFGDWIEDSRLEDATGTGFMLEGGGLIIRDFEAHPQAVPIPADLHFDAPWSRFGERTIFEDDFSGPAGNLAGHMPKGSDIAWERTVGTGVVELDGVHGAKVRASVESPFPNRAFYTLPWGDPGFADLEVSVVPPGTARGQDHRCRAGLVFWQDRNNYLSITTWLDDVYEGASMSVFTKRRGFEELYDAVWTNVADKIVWGRQFRLRIPFDGEHFNIFIDDEPIMQRALTDLYPDDPPLRINRVGIALNWEWGTDTGSTIDGFLARR